VIEHTIQLDDCPKCCKVVAPVVSDAMPSATIGHRTVVLSAFLHDFVGIPISKIITIFNIQFFFKLTQGGLMNLWHRLASVLNPWYDEIGEMVKTSGVMHADETGWRQRKGVASRLSYRSLPTTRSRCSLVLSTRRCIPEDADDQRERVTTPTR
jgi:hypothetical protein